MVTVVTALPIPDHVSLEHMMANHKLERALEPEFVAILEMPLATMMEYPLVLC